MFLVALGLFISYFNDLQLENMTNGLHYLQSHFDYELNCYLPYSSGRLNLKGLFEEQFSFCSSRSKTTFVKNQAEL